MQISSPDRLDDCSITHRSEGSEKTSFTTSKTSPWEQSPERGKTVFLTEHNYH